MNIRKCIVDTGVVIDIRYAPKCYYTWSHDFYVTTLVTEQQQHHVIKAFLFDCHVFHSKHVKSVLKSHSNMSSFFFREGHESTEDGCIRDCYRCIS